MDDQDIIKLYWDRSERAIKETDQKYGRYCHGISFNIVQNNQDAEECVSDTYLNVWNAIPPTHPRYFMAFIGRIVRNISLNLLKRRNSLKRCSGEVELAIDELEECLSGGNSVDDEFNRKIVVDCINDFLSNQEELNADVFIRRYWYFDKISDISRRYGIKENTVSSILFRMRKELRVALEEEGVLI